MLKLKHNHGLVIPSAGTVQITLLAENTIRRSVNIHSVMNHSDRVTVSLHTYGMHVNHTDRSQYDIENNLEIPFTVIEQ